MPMVKPHLSNRRNRDVSNIFAAYFALAPDEHSILKAHFWLLIWTTLILVELSSRISCQSITQKAYWWLLKMMVMIVDLVDRR